MEDSLNFKLIKLIKDWRASGSADQESFNWSISRANWLNAFPSEENLIKNLNEEIDRHLVREICQSKNYTVREKFLTSMIWGYGNRGYGSYRVTQMLSQVNSQEILQKVYELCNLGEPIDAYEFLEKNRIRQLGPSYGSKFMNFCTPRDVGAPIYDSLISMWISTHAKKDFSGFSTSTDSWNVKIYNRYWDWVKLHANHLDCFPDEIELVLFRDAEKQFAKSSSWSNK